jgi:hypothetical protein
MSNPTTHQEMSSRRANVPFKISASRDGVAVHKAWLQSDDDHASLPALEQRLEVAS